MFNPIAVAAYDLEAGDPLPIPPERDPLPGEFIRFRGPDGYRDRHEVVSWDRPSCTLVYKGYAGLHSTTDTDWKVDSPDLPLEPPMVRQLAWVRSNLTRKHRAITKLIDLANESPDYEMPSCENCRQWPCREWKGCPDYLALAVGSGHAAKLREKKEKPKRTKEKAA